MDTPGLSFSPLGKTPANSADPTQGVAPMQDAIKLLSLKIPQIVGGAPSLAPPSLMGGLPSMQAMGPSPFGGGSGPVGFNLDEILRRLFGQMSQLPGPTAAPATSPLGRAPSPTVTPGGGPLPTPDPYRGATTPPGPQAGPVSTPALPAPAIPQEPQGPAGNPFSTWMRGERLLQ